MKKLFLFVISAFISFTVFAQVSEEERMANYKDESYAKTISDFGFSSIKKLPAKKNVIRLCSSSPWGSYAVIEMTWTNSSASIVYTEGIMSFSWIEDDEDISDVDKINITKKTERKIKKQEVEKILDLIKKTDFYAQPRYVFVETKKGERVEAITWYVEVNIDGSYRSLSRWDPHGTFLKQLGDALYDLAKEK